MVNPNFKLLSDKAKMPEMGYSTDGGIDLFLANPVSIPVGGMAITDLEISWNPCFQYEDGRYIRPDFEVFYRENFNITMILKSRSSKSMVENVEINTGGVIDFKYDGSIKLKLFNQDERPIFYPAGEKIAQALVIIQPKIIGVYFKKEGTRGGNGFGSTGNV